MVDFASLFGRVAAVAGTGALGGVWDSLQEYLGGLASAAADKWAVDMALGTKCKVCDRRAFGRCERCQLPACLFHGRMSSEADVLCERCIDELLGRKRKTRHGRAPRDPERAAALEVLGLDDDASWEDVQVRFRELTAKLHPDKVKDPVKKKKAEEKFKRVTVAYEALKRRAAA